MILLGSAWLWMEPECSRRGRDRSPCPNGSDQYPRLLLASAVALAASTVCVAVEAMRVAVRVVDGHDHCGNEGSQRLL